MSKRRIGAYPSTKWDMRWVAEELNEELKEEDLEMVDDSCCKAEPGVLCLSKDGANE